MKKILVFILTIVMLISMTACGNSKNEDKLYNENDPIQIVDGAGRKVSFPEPVNTIATSWGGTCDPFIFHWAYRIDLWQLTPQMISISL